MARLPGALPPVQTRMSRKAASKAAASKAGGSGEHDLMPRFNWTRPELVLAVDLLARRGWRPVRRGEVDAERLSRVLQALTLHPVAGRPEQFRSPSSVQRKTYDIVTGLKGYRGAPTRGSQLEGEVVAEYRQDAVLLHAEAARLRALGGDPTWGQRPVDGGD